MWGDMGERRAHLDLSRSLPGAFQEPSRALLGTSLAFMMPIIIRGIKDANYELVKKATVCASNLCALIKDSSDIAPFVPLLLPLLEKNVDHSSPNIREATQTARERLLEGNLGQSRVISGDLGYSRVLSGDLGCSRVLSGTLG